MILKNFSCEFVTLLLSPIYPILTPRSIKYLINNILNINLFAKEILYLFFNDFVIYFKLSIKNSFKFFLSILFS